MMLKSLATVGLLVLVSPPVCALTLDEWVSGTEFRNYALIDKVDIEGSYFALFRSETEMIVASRRLVEIGSTGGHRVQFELLDRKGMELIASKACPKRQLKTGYEPCGEYYCDFDTTAYLVRPKYEGPFRFKYRWQWITADIADVDEMRQYIIDHLKNHELPVIMRGTISWE